LGGDDWVPPVTISKRMYGFLTENAFVRNKVEEFKIWCLIEALEAINIHHFDDHTTNVGYIDGRLVCIDFDKNSCEEAKKKEIHARNNRV
jgi:hypothetical protein